MNPSEAIELAGIHTANALAAFSIYLTVTFAYLVAAYVTGSTFTRFQYIVISCMYFLVAATCIGMVAISQQYYAEVLSLNPDLAEKIWMHDVSVWMPFMVALLFSGVFISIYFLHDIRERAST